MKAVQVILFLPLNLLPFAKTLEGKTANKRDRQAKFGKTIRTEMQNVTECKV
ncbi:MAG: hypothetical protein ACFCUV_20535 [Rivularia sp. (in: cyanobacteria)]